MTKINKYPKKTPGKKAQNHENTPSQNCLVTSARSLLPSLMLVSYVMMPLLIFLFLKKILKKFFLKPDRRAFPL